MKQVVVYTPEHLSVQQVLSDRANPERAEEKRNVGHLIMYINTRLV